MANQYAQQYAFAAGRAVATRTDLTGSTAIEFGTMQDISVDIKGDMKKLRGQGRYLSAIGNGAVDIDVKIKFAQMKAPLYNLFFGATTTVGGGGLLGPLEAATIPATTPFTYTALNGATFKADQGVYYAATGAPMTNTSPSAPTAAGQYSVNSTTGTYTFFSTDAGLGVYIGYSYTSATSVVIPITQKVMGDGPAFSLIMGNSLDGRFQSMTLNSLKASSVSVPFKQDDWLICEIDAMAQADIAGNIGQWVMAA